MKNINVRFKNYRISINKTQQDIANESGLSIAAVKAFEKGKDIKLSNLNKLLKVIGYEGYIDNIIEDVTDRPRYKFDYKIRQRVRRSKPKKEFIWEEDK